MHVNLIVVTFSAIFLILFLSFFDKDYQSETEETFQATHEWKEIKKGQKVSPDLDYRINLDTGKKEAKLSEVPEDYLSRTPEEIKEILRKDLQMRLDLNKLENLPKIEKIMKDIEEELGTNLETLKGFFKKYQEEEKGNPQVIIKILRDIKHLAQQTGNGNDFCDLNGFKKIIYMQLNSTDIAIRLETLKLFSVLAHHNPEVKKHILETGGIPILLKMLNQENNNLIQDRILTALGSSLRAYPKAQYKFMETKGLTILTALFKKGIVKLKLRIVTFLRNLMVEKHVNSFGDREFIAINQALFNLNWCNLLNEFLHALIISDKNNLKSIQKCIMPMSLLANKCQNVFKTELMMFFIDHKTFIENEQGKSAEYYGRLKSLVLQLIGANKEEL